MEPPLISQFFSYDLDFRVAIGPTPHSRIAQFRGFKHLEPLELAAGEVPHPDPRPQ